MLADPRSEALTANFAGQWLQLRNVDAGQAVRSAVPGLRRHAAPGLQARDRALLRQHPARGPQRARSAVGRLHVPERSAGAALRHPEREGQPLPARDADRREPPRPARPGQHPDDDVAAGADLAGVPRQVDSRQHSRHAAARSAAQRAAAAREDRRLRRENAVDARTDVGAPRERDVRDLPLDDRPARLRARELRSDRPVAQRRRDVRADRRERQSARRHQVRRRRRAARGAREASGSLRRARSPRSCSPTRSAAASSTTTCRRCGRS